jgi:beta propeller repeat protein
VKSRKGTLGILVMILSFYLLSAEGSVEFQITTNNRTQQHPAIYEDITVWEDERNGNWDIYGYSFSTSQEFQITTDPSYQRNPTIYGDTVVWEDERNNNADIYNSDIYAYNLLTKEEFSITTDPNSQWCPAIYGNIVIWSDNRNGNWDIYGYDLLTGQEFQISTNESDQMSPAIYEDVIVWEDERNSTNDIYNVDIYGYDLSAKEEFQITTDPSNQGRPAIYENFATWEDWRNGPSDIYGYNFLTEEEFQISTNTLAEYHPSIYEDIVVWMEYRNNNWDIHGYEFSTKRVFRITKNEKDQRIPSIYGNIVVWEDNRNWNHDIYGCNLLEVFPDEPSRGLLYVVLVIILITILGVVLKKKKQIGALILREEKKQKKHQAHVLKRKIMKSKRDIKRIFTVFLLIILFSIFISKIVRYYPIRFRPYSSLTPPIPDDVLFQIDQVFLILLIVEIAAPLILSTYFFCVYVARKIRPLLVWGVGFVPYSKLIYVFFFIEREEAVWELMIVTAFGMILIYYGASLLFFNRRSFFREIMSILITSIYFVFISSFAVIFSSNIYMLSFLFREELILATPVFFVMAILFYRFSQETDLDGFSKRTFLMTFVAWALLGIGTVSRGLFSESYYDMVSVTPFLLAYILLITTWIFVLYNMITRKAAILVWEKKEQEKKFRVLICPQCKNRIQENWATCPYCKTRLK